MKQSDSGDALVVAASAAAITLAKGRSRREIDRMILFFSCLITNLTTLSGHIIVVDDAL